MVFLQLPKVTKKTQQREGQFLYHVDLDCFFAAVEIREDPELAGKPVAVGDVILATFRANCTGLGNSKASYTDDITSTLFS